MAKRPTPDKPGLTRRQLSRAQREARIQRLILIGTAVIAILIIGLLAFAVLNETVIKPNRTVLRVNEDEVSAADFQDRVKFDYFTQTGGQPIEQLGIDKTFFGDLTMSNLTSELIIRQQAAEHGIEVTDEEIEEELQLAFGYDAGDPEPTPTALPTEAASSEPTATPTFVYTLTPSPTPTLEPGVTPTATPSGPPTQTPTPLPLPTAEPLTEEDYTQQLDEYLTLVSEGTGLSRSRVEELVQQQVAVSLLSQRLREELNLEIEETKTLVHAAHILVGSEDEAQQVLERINNGESFEELAAELSQDASNAYRGGDLGWLSPGDTVEEFETVAFSLEEGEISQPVESNFGWHIIKVYEREENVPLTEAEKFQAESEAFRALLTEWEQEADIERADNWQAYIPDL